MIFEIYAFFLLVSIIGIFLGYYSEVDVLKLVGFLFIFILGTTLFGFNGSGIDYRTSDTLVISGNTTSVTYGFTPYNNVTLGFYLAVLGALGFASVFLQRKGGGIDEQ